MNLALIGLISFLAQPSAAFTCDKKAPPLTLSLELLQPAVAKVEHWHTLWYKITATNKSCRRAKFSPDFFNRYDEPSEKAIVITDPEGRRVEPTNRFKSWRPYPTEYDDIEPYQIDEEFNRSLHYELSRLGDVEVGPPDLVLQPGESVSTAPSIFDPMLVGRIDTVDYEGEKRFALHQAIHRYKIPRPPHGFRSLEGYVLKSPGTYRIKFVLEVSVLAEPTDWLYDWMLKLPWILKLALYESGALEHLHIDVVHMHAATEPIEFKVVP